METNLLDRMLNAYLTGQQNVTVVLQNKVRVQGKISAFDSYVLVMDGQKREIVYRHAIASVTPSGPVVEVKPAEKKRSERPKKPAEQPERAPRQKPRPQQPLPAEQTISNSMKEGLLRWMQEQKAAK